MIIVEPLTIGDRDYVTSNISEDEFDEWAIGEEYKRGKYVMVSSVHAVYQCLRDHDSDFQNGPIAESVAVTDPLTLNPDPLHWVYVGATNRWRLFDGRPSQRAAKEREIRATIRLSSRICSVNLISLEDCSAATIEIIQDGNKANLEWTTPAQGASTIVSWEYRFREDGGDWEDWTPMVGSSRNTESWIVSGLNPDKRHDFQVRALNLTDIANESNIAELVVTSESL